MKRLAVDWKNPLDFCLTEKSGFHEDQTGFRLPNSQLQLIGTVTHRLLQHLCENGVDEWQRCAHSQKLNLIKTQLLQLGGLSSQVDSSAETILTAIENTLKDPHGQWILHPHREARSEYALTAVINNKITACIIDRTFIDEEGVRWIIDYKTAHFPGDDLEKFLILEQEKYAAQFEKYVQAIKKMECHNSNNSTKIQCALYFPLMALFKVISL